jgi:hypothetical protein
MNGIKKSRVIVCKSVVMFPVEWYVPPARNDVSCALHVRFEPRMGARDGAEKKKG